MVPSPLPTLSEFLSKPMSTDASALTVPASDSTRILTLHLNITITSSLLILTLVTYWSCKHAGVQPLNFIMSSMQLILQYIIPQYCSGDIVSSQPGHDGSDDTHEDGDTTPYSYQLGRIGRLSMSSPDSSPEDSEDINPSDANESIE
ncbi:hypothetical protein QCA50_006570 [Cerrena zonata]|uniref:Uncharacterized protein n=1 Tax=Cerrena zonata TaxID=2478898 RepID=A0AAW0G9A2_9APHY